MDNIIEIVIVAGGMAFGPNTLDVKSLGGSETAVIGVARELKKRGHVVTVFCPLPQPGLPDFHPSGEVAQDGVRYVDIQYYGTYIQSTEVDLLVVSRSPELFQVRHQAKKAVLWCHDLATYNGPAEHVKSVAWNFDEIWCVSEYHRQQYHKVTGYPLENIRATRNGAMRYDWIPFPRNNKQLLYAARPERGMINLVRPGGIMSRLLDYQLKMTMYDNFPQHMMPFYNQMFEWARALPNVEILPPSKQDFLRQLMADSAAYVYPTEFEETSCIMAREAMDTKTPFITCEVGALPETLGDCGTFVRSAHQYGSDEWCQDFADAIRNCVEDELAVQSIQRRMGERTDLHWDGVAEQWEEWAGAAPDLPLFSKAWSLVEDSDIIAALALIDETPVEARSRSVTRLRSELDRLYPYLTGKCTLAEYYENYFVREDEKGARARRTMVGNPRFEVIATQVAGFRPGSVIVDYGCAEGVIILDLAERFPNLAFVGVDHAATNVELCKKYAKEMKLGNVTFFVAEKPQDILKVSKHGTYDGAICSEVLEHVEKPWELIYELEKFVKPKGRIIITVPQGPWEAMGLYDKEQYNWRAHIWHVNKWMLRRMFADKSDCQMLALFNGHYTDERYLGHLLFAYEADGKPANAIDPLEKAKQARYRQTTSACMIVKNGEETLSKCLNSLGDQVQQIHIAVSEDTSDLTFSIIERYKSEHPWMFVHWFTVPSINPGKFGFDDARNASIAGIDTDWFLWIDSDEYLSGSIRKYTRNNAFDSYAIHQHHFTCDPRGTPAQLDKPARLCRAFGFTFYGKVHEHAEKGFNGGPGFCFVPNDVDIGHTGYVNETVRRSRFDRNFPLLAWDREVNPDRKLGKYLWLRDIIHRMRYMVEQQQGDQARLLAEEAVSFYKEHWENWDDAGMGGMSAVQYYSEAVAFLGRGLPVNVGINVNNMPLVIQGIFETEEDVTKMITKSLSEIFKQRNSGYWQ